MIRTVFKCGYCMQADSTVAVKVILVAVLCALSWTAGCSSAYIACSAWCCNRISCFFLSKGYPYR